jgi:hypothetical protein
MVTCLTVLNASPVKGNIFRVFMEIKIRIIPSKLWGEELSTYVGLLIHESLHELLFGYLSNVSPDFFSKLDNLPRPTSLEDFLTGVWGWNLNDYPWKCYLRRPSSILQALT